MKFKANKAINAVLTAVLFLACGSAVQRTSDRR